MKAFRGKIISLKMQKTAVVQVQRTIVHPLYKKVLRRRKKYKVDTGDLTLSLGDTVKIVETRPISKDKNFKIEKIIK
ncbi:MAG TPA: 30S ribosomal protein S17 [Patescibacteria group bacterium]|nr:30S ribosomal protein S17 [Patescibacteria group bacterium]